MQCGVFEEVFAGEVPLFYVGDPKQAIQVSRRGHPRLSRCDLRRKKHQLGTNYRSTPGSERERAVFKREYALSDRRDRVSEVESHREENMLRTGGKPVPSFRIATLDPAALTGGEWGAVSATL